MREAGGGALKFLRSILKEKNLHGSGQVRVNRAGCFNRCQRGPVLVVYPEAVWYRYDSEDDLRQIAEEHLINGNVVTKLVLE